MSTFFLSCRHGKFSAGGSFQNSYRTSRQGAGLCRRCHRQSLITHEHSATCENLVTLGSEMRCADRCNPSTCATSESVAHRNRRSGRTFETVGGRCTYRALVRTTVVGLHRPSCGRCWPSRKEEVEDSTWIGSLLGFCEFSSTALVRSSLSDLLYDYDAKG